MGRLRNSVSVQLGGAGPWAWLPAQVCTWNQVPAPETGCAVSGSLKPWPFSITLPWRQGSCLGGSSIVRDLQPRGPAEAPADLHASTVPRDLSQNPQIQRSCELLGPSASLWHTDLSTRQTRRAPRTAAVVGGPSSVPGSSPLGALGSGRRKELWCHPQPPREGRSRGLQAPCLPGWARPAGSRGSAVVGDAGPTAVVLRAACRRSPALGLE